MAAANAHPTVEALALLVQEQEPGLAPEARTQVAFVLALIDEIDRRPPNDPLVTALLAQLEEEVARLARELERAPDARGPGRAVAKA